MPAKNASAADIDALLRDAAAQFQMVSDSAEADAAWLLADSLGYKQCKLSQLRAAQPSPDQQMRFAQAVERRRQGEPVAYILGEWDFWDFSLKLNPDVLIPRPETELLVETCLSKLSSESTGQILDLGTGSGAIALAIAKERPQTQLTATDQSAAALRVAASNAAQLGLNNVRFVHSDWFQELADQRFDLIASNPPYIDPSDPCLAKLSREPSSALIAADHGMADLRRIVQQAPNQLNQHGWLLLEHGADQAAEVRRELSRADFSHIATLRDYAGHERISLGQWRSEHIK